VRVHQLLLHRSGRAQPARSGGASQPSRVLLAGCGELAAVPVL